jgi:Flp pilus assembly protein TadG
VRTVLGESSVTENKRQVSSVRPRKRTEEGAALVEFAVLAPLLILLLFGIIEFAWLFSQNLDARHGAREGARIAAVDEFVDTDSSGAVSPAETAQQVCTRMDSAAISGAGGTLITTTRTGTTVGSDITVTVDSPPQSLTGLFTSFIPSTLRLVATTTIRLEQPDPIWPVFANEVCP